MQEEPVSRLSTLLLECEHSGFPVVNSKQQLIGSVTRRTLAVVLEYHFDQNKKKVTSSFTLANCLGVQEVRTS